MKKFFSVVVIGSVLMVLVAATAQAQLPGTAIRATIPFDFKVEGRTLPAGNYEIRRINDDESIGLLIRNVDDKHDKAMFETEPVEMRDISGKDVLVFNRYGDVYFLSEVETAGEQTAREVYPSRSERHLRREMAANQLEPQAVSVVCN
jgi:hypothetical protein